MPRAYFAPARERIGSMVWGGWLLGLTVCLSGCQVPASHVQALADTDGPHSRSAACRRQFVRDSAVQIASHPLDTTRAVVGVRVNHWFNVSRRLWDQRNPEASWQGIWEGDLRPARVALYPDGAEALTALEEVIDQASCRIDILAYIWESDPVGEALARRLAAKASPQLPVRVLVDGGGNLQFGRPREASAAEVNRVIRWLARQPYVQVIRTRDPGLHYDHRKLVMVDGRFVWAGGRNFSVRGFFEQRDLSFIVAGPVVENFQQRFEDFWRRQGGNPVPLSWMPPVEDVNALARLIETDPPQLGLEKTFYRAVDAARQHIFIENFALADRHLLHRLMAARKRGVDVRVVTTVRSTTGIINHANRVIVNRLLRAGVRVYLNPAMTHTKAMTVDGCWAYTGSGNFDPLSLRRNHEIGLVIEAGPIIAELEERLLTPDQRPEWEMTETLPVEAGDYFFAWLTMTFL